MSAAGPPVESLLRAACSNLTETIDFYARYWPDQIDAAGPDGVTALMAAAAHGQRAAVECLLRHGASLAATSNRGEGALMLAVKGAHTDIVRALVERGASVLAQNAEGVSPHAWAQRHGPPEIAELLEQQRSKELDAIGSNMHTGLTKPMAVTKPDWHFPGGKMRDGE